MRRVYLVNLNFGLAGIERRFANLSAVLRRRGVVCPVLVIPAALASRLEEAGLLPEDPGALVVIPEPAPLALFGRLQLPPGFDSAFAIIRSRIASLRLRPVWRDIQRDPNAVIHIGLTCSALRPPDVPTVYECVDSTLKNLDSRLFRRAARRRSVIHCQTDRIRSALDARHALRQPRWRTVTNPTCFAEYGPETSAGERDPQLVAFAGRLHETKNPLLFIEAVALARRRGCPCRVLMLGEGPLQSQVEALVAHHGLQSAVSIRFQPEVVSSLRNASAFVSLQTDDNYPSQSLLEAMGAGCAIIASDVGVTSKLVTDDVGIRVPLTADAVSQAIESLVTDSERARRLGIAAERLVRTQYSADVYASFLESLYEHAVQYHPGPAPRP